MKCDASVNSIDYYYYYRSFTSGEIYLDCFAVASANAEDM